MLEFIRRIQEMLRLRRKPAPDSAGSPKASGPAKEQPAKAALRGRGTGRGITPPSPRKPKGNRPQNRRKK